MCCGNSRPIPTEGSARYANAAFAWDCEARGACIRPPLARYAFNANSSDWIAFPSKFVPKTRLRSPHHVFHERWPPPINGPPPVFLTPAGELSQVPGSRLPGVSWPFNCRKKLRVAIVLEVMRGDPNHSGRVRELLTDPDQQMEGMFKGITGLGQIYRRQRETVLSIFMPCQSWNPRWSHLEC